MPHPPARDIVLGDDPDELDELDLSDPDAVEEAHEHVITQIMGAEAVLDDPAITGDDRAGNCGFLFVQEGDKPAPIGSNASTLRRAAIGRQQRELDPAFDVEILPGARPSWVGTHHPGRDATTRFPNRGLPL